MRNAEYWAERALNEALMGERSVLEYENALLDAYRVALREIKKDLESFFSKYARENKVTYAEARRRLVSAEMKEFKATVKMWLDYARQNGWNRVYIQYLEKLLNMKYITRLEMLEADIRYQIELIENNKEKNIKDLMEINYLAAYYVRYHDFATGAEMSVRFDTIDAHTLAQAVAKKWDDGNYSTRVWNDRNRLVKAMATILPQSFSRGLNVNKLGDMLAKELNVSQNRGRTLARTETRRTSPWIRRQESRNISLLQRWTVERLKFVEAWTTPCMRSVRQEPVLTSHPCTPTVVLRPLRIMRTCKAWKELRKILRVKISEFLVVCLRKSGLKSMLLKKTEINYFNLRVDFINLKNKSLQTEEYAI